MSDFDTFTEVVDCEQYPDDPYCNQLWAKDYAAYCAAKEAAELETSEVESIGAKIEQQAEDEDWAIQYQNYCIL